MARTTMIAITDAITMFMSLVFVPQAKAKFSSKVMANIRIRKLNLRLRKLLGKMKKVTVEKCLLSAVTFFYVSFFL